MHTKLMASLSVSGPSYTVNVLRCQDQTDTEDMLQCLLSGFVGVIAFASDALHSSCFECFPQGIPLLDEGAMQVDEQGKLQSSTVSVMLQAACPGGDQLRSSFHLAEPGSSPEGCWQAGGGRKCLQAVP